MARLPLDHALRNLSRRPLRTALAALSAAATAALLLATASFAGGMERSFSGNGRPDVAILMSAVAERDLVRSTVSAAVPGLVAASVPGLVSVAGTPAVSAEIHMGSNLRRAGDDRERPAFVRGVTDRAFLVHEAVTLVEGRLPRTDEVLVGSLVAGQLGVPVDALAPGRKLLLEGGTFTVSGRFAAPGTTLEAEVWVPLLQLRALTRRDDASAVCVRLAGPAAFAELDLFAKRRLDLELVAIGSDEYYAALAAYVRPIGGLAWALAALVCAAALLSCASTLNASVQDRLPELAVLRALGFSGRALAGSLAVESVLLAAAGGVLGLLLARAVLSGHVVRLAMSAFALDIRAPAILLAFGGVLLLGLLGAAPAVVRALRLPVAAALREP